jgi:integrase
MHEVINKMRLYDDNSGRLYLSVKERELFRDASRSENKEQRMFCQILLNTGCRPQEALNLQVKNIFLNEMCIQFRSLKKRKMDKAGNIKKPEYRTIPVQERFIELLDLAFDLKRKMNNKESQTDLLFTMHRQTAYRAVVNTMNKAGIKGSMAMPKGLRHGFAIALLMGEKPAPIHIVSKLLGHSDISTTEIYLQAVGDEQRTLVMQALY